MARAKNIARLGVIGLFLVFIFVITVIPYFYVNEGFLGGKLKRGVQCVNDKDCADPYNCESKKCGQVGVGRDCLNDDTCIQPAVCNKGKCSLLTSGSACKSNVECKSKKCNKGKCL